MLQGIVNIKKEQQHGFFILSLALAFVAIVLVTMISIADDSDAGFTVDGIMYEITSDNDVGVIQDYYSGKIVIPSSVKYNSKTYNVTSISSFAFDRCTSLTSVNIPGSVTSIGDRAFNRCTSLTSVNIPDSITSISDYTFAYCSSLKSATIPDSVTFIGNYSFAYCSSLESVSIPECAKSVGYKAFCECTSLTSVIIHNCIASFSESTFQGCTFFDFDGKTEITDYYYLRGYRYIGESSSKLIRYDLYNVFFDENGGSLGIKGMYVEEGAEFTLPEYTGTKTGHDFCGWSYGENVYKAGQTVVKESGKMIFTAVWEPIQCSAVFMNGDDVYSSRTYDYGSVIIAPEGIPEKAPTAQYTYEFSNWSGFTEGTVITGDISFDAVFNEVPRTYEIKFVSEGIVKQERYLIYGAEIPKMIQDPVKPSDKSCDYKFVRWSGFTVGMKVTGNMTFVAVFEAIIKTIDASGEKVIIDTKGVGDVKASSEIVDQIRNAGSSGKGTEITMSKGKIALDSASAAGLPSGAKEISLNNADTSKIPSDIKQKIGDRPVYSISFGEVHEFKGTLTVSLKYELKDGEKAENVCIWYLKDDGSYEMLSARYADGYATFTTSHLSEYAVMVEEPQPSSSESGSNIGLIIGGIVGAIAVIAIAAFIVMRSKH